MNNVHRLDEQGWERSGHDNGGPPGSGFCMAAQGSCNWIWLAVSCATETGPPNVPPDRRSPVDRFDTGPIEHAATRWPRDEATTCIDDRI